MALQRSTPRARRIVQATLLGSVAILALAGPAAGQVAPFVGCPEWLADGSTLVYCGGNNGFAEIYEVTQEGKIRQLTFLGGQASAPAVSPDGTLVVFQATRVGQEGSQLYAIRRDGQRGRTVIVGSAVIEVPGERAVRLTSEGSNVDPTFRPDGSRILFTSDRTGIATLWSMNVDGSDQSEMHLATLPG